MLRSLLIIAMMTIAPIAVAQDQSAHGSDYKATTIDHETDALYLSDQPELIAAYEAGGDVIVAKVLGVVCDFCAQAMKKTFGRREDFAAVYVDLDAKTLNLVLNPGYEISDDQLAKAVKKSGYKIKNVQRGAALVQN